jgi:quinol monooxygenase YgiN
MGQKNLRAGTVTSRCVYEPGVIRHYVASSRSNYQGRLHLGCSSASKSFADEEYFVIPEIIRYRIPVSECDAFIDAYRAAGEILKQSPNCHGFELIRSSKDAQLFLLTILWDSAEGHMQGFRRSEHFRRFFALIKPFVARIEEMEHYAYTDLRWTRSAAR